MRTNIILRSRILIDNLSVAQPWYETQKFISTCRKAPTGARPEQDKSSLHPYKFRLYDPPWEPQIFLVKTRNYKILTQFTTEFLCPCDFTLTQVFNVTFNGQIKCLVSHTNCKFTTKCYSSVTFYKFQWKWRFCCCDLISTRKQYIELTLL